MNPCERWGLTLEQSIYAEGVVQRTGLSLETVAKMIAQMVKPVPPWYDSAR